MPRIYPSFMTTASIIVGLGFIPIIGVLEYTTHKDIDNRTEFVRSNLEPDAPFLGLGEDTRYKDADSNGKLETYKKFPHADGNFHRVIINADGSYRLIPSNQIK